MIGWKMNTDARGKFYVYLRDGKPTGAPRVNRATIDAASKIQKGMLFFNLMKSIERVVSGAEKDLAFHQTYALIHSINDDPEATIPLNGNLYATIKAA